MAEKAVFYARAVVYYFDPRTKNWTPTQVGSNFCRVDMYENTTTNTFRVIGRALADTTKVVINSNVTKDTQYTRASETFHQWSDTRYIYGLNFPTKDEAENFGGGFENTITKLKGETSPSESAPPPPPATQLPVQVHQPPTAPTPPTPPTPPSAPQPPPAPQPPAAPTPPQAPETETRVGGGDENRNALLSSIQGFGKGGLKKVQTNDRSAPVASKDKASSNSGPAGPTPTAPKGGLLGELANRQKQMGKTPTKEPTTPVKAPQQTLAPTKNTQSRTTSSTSIHEPKPTVSVTPASSNSLPPPDSGHTRQRSGSASVPSGITSSDLEKLKEEILTEMRKEIQQMKEEILAALKH